MSTDRFDDPLLLVAAVLPDTLELLHVLRQHKRLREEAELLLAEVRLHLAQVAPQAVLASDLERAREVVDLLVFLDRLEARGFHVFAPRSQPIAI